MSAEPIGIGYVPEWTFADKLRKARRTTSMTQKAFAAALGEEEKAYSQWESGNNRPRHLVEVCKEVESLTGVSAAWLLGVVPPSGATGSGLRMGYPQKASVGRVVHIDEHRFRSAA